MVIMQTKIYDNRKKLSQKDTFFHKKRFFKQLNKIDQKNKKLQRNWRASTVFVFILTINSNNHFTFSFEEL